MKKQLFLTLAVLTVITSLSCMNSQSSSNFVPGAYQGTPVQPGNTLELLQRETPLSETHREQVQQFIRENGLAEILSGAEHERTFFTGTPEERVALRDAIEAQLKQKGVQNGAVSSYVFEVPGTNLVIKSARPFLRRQNVVDTLESEKNGKRSWAEWGRVLSSEEWQKYTEEYNNTTQQTVSRACLSLLLHQAVCTHQTDKIKTPVTHLVQIPGKDTEVKDRNYVVVEERYIAADQQVGQNHDKPLHETNLAVDESIILGLVKIIGDTGLWSMANLKVYNGTVYIQEQLPNRHDLRHVLYKDVNHFYQLVEHGWKELEEKVIQAYAQQHTIDTAELLAKMHTLQDKIRNAHNMPLDKKTPQPD